MGLDVRDYSGSARLVHGRGKGNKDRVIGLPEPACAALDAYLKQRQGIGPDADRHSYATELLERGADIRDIRDLLGHESVATTEIYTHVSAARQRRTVQLLEK